MSQMGTLNSLASEFDLVGKFLPLQDGFLDLILYHRYVGNRWAFLPIPFLALLVLEAFGDCLAHTHDVGPILAWSQEKKT